MHSSPLQSFGASLLRLGATMRPTASGRLLYKTCSRYNRSVIRLYDLTTLLAVDYGVLALVYLITQPLMRPYEL